MAKVSKQSGDSCAQAEQVTLVLPLMGPHSPAPHTPTAVVGIYGYSWMVSLGSFHLLHQNKASRPVIRSAQPPPPYPENDPAALQG